MDKDGRHTLKLTDRELGWLINGLTYKIQAHDLDIRNPPSCGRTVSFQRELELELYQIRTLQNRLDELRLDEYTPEEC